MVSIGRSNFDPVYTEAEHVDDKCELMHVLRGAVEVVTPGYSIVCRKGDTIMLPSGVPHRDVGAQSPFFEVYLVQFHWKDERAVWSRFSPTEISAAAQKAKRRVSAMFHQLYQDFVADLPFTRQLAGARILEIVLTLCQEAGADYAGSHPDTEKTGDARKRQIMTQAQDYIRRNFAKPVRLETIASELNISPYHLSHVFSEQSGFTLSSYLMDVRLENAASRLKDTRMNVSEVALAVGFRDIGYFRRVFKNRFKISPMQYRSRLLSEQQPLG